MDKKTKSGSAGSLMDIFQRTSKTQRSPPACTSSSCANLKAPEKVKNTVNDNPDTITITTLQQAAEFIKNLQSELIAVRAELATARKEDSIKNLQSELAAAKAELATSRKENKTLKEPSLPLENRYSPLDTSEEEELVEKETAWRFPTTTTSTRVTEAEQTRKKRRRTHTKTPPSANINSAVIKQDKPKVPLPPPINVSNINNFELFRQKVLTTTGEPKFKALSNNDIKITVQTETEYRNVKTLLEEIKKSPTNQLGDIEYHTYQLKSDKLYRFVVRGLPSSISIDEIKTDLQKMGHEVENITNVFKMVTIDGVKIRKTFPLFYVDLKQKENNKDVFNIKALAYCIVKIEAPKKAKGIPQCTNCQQLGHTKSFCHRHSKCVKCADGHHTKQCEKKRETEPTCALCQCKGHTANYKGCPVYQKKLKSQTQEKISAVQRMQANAAKPQATAITTATSGITYAQYSKKTVNKPHFDNEQSKINNEQQNNDIIKMLSQIQQTLSQLTERVEKLEKLQTTKQKSQQNKK